MPAPSPRFFRPSVELLESRDTPSAIVAHPAANPTWMARHQGFVAAAQRGTDVVFLGDSITDRWQGAGRAAWHAAFAPLGAVDFGISGDGVGQVLWRVQHGEIAPSAPRVVVLLIGTNDLRLHTPAEVAAGVGAITDAIHAQSPETKILLSGLLPRGDSAESPYRPAIAAVNQLLAAQDDGVAVHFVDPGSAFVNPDGSLRRDLLPDTLHPGPEGYRVLAGALSPDLHALLAPAPVSLTSTDLDSSVPLPAQDASSAALTFADPPLELFGASTEFTPLPLW